jgi:hypothetical protein
MFKSSHRPNGRLTFCSLFAGRWCLCRGWHSVDRELPDLLQHSSQCARSSSKVPIAPMGDSRVAHCLQGGGVYVRGGTVSIVNSQIYSNTASLVRASHACKFPIAPMGKCLIDMSISILFVYYGCCLELPGSSTCYLCLKLQKFPSPPWEITCFAFCACRVVVMVAVSMSSRAQ